MKKTVMLFFTFVYSLSLIAQDTHFSQYNTSKTYTNPAFTGTDSTWVLSSAVRFQWPQAFGGYQAYFFSVDNYFRGLRGGLGLNYMHEIEVEGVMKRTQIDLNYAPHFELFDHRLAIQAGIQFSYFQRSVNWSKLTFGDMIDSTSGNVYPTKDLPVLSSKANLDASGGLLVYSKQFYGGFAFHHIPEPDEGLVGSSRLPLKYTMHAGMNSYFNHFTLSPNVMYQKQQDFQLFIASLALNYKWLTASVGLGNSGSFYSSIGLQNRFFKISYAYDQTLNRGNNYSSGSHEIHLNWYIKHRKPKKINTLRLI